MITASIIIAVLSCIALYALYDAGQYKQHAKNWRDLYDVKVQQVRMCEVEIGLLKYKLSRGNQPRDAQGRFVSRDVD